MNKSNLIENVAQKSNVSRPAAEQAVNCMLDSITTALSDGEKVTLVGFGTFYTYVRSARRGRNPKTGEAIAIGSKQVVKFKAGSRLNRYVK